MAPCPGLPGQGAIKPGGASTRKVKPLWIVLASFKSRLVSPFWYRLTQVVLEKRLLNGCSSGRNKAVKEAGKNSALCMFLNLNHKYISGFS